VVDRERRTLQLSTERRAARRSLRRVGWRETDGELRRTEGRFGSGRRVHIQRQVDRLTCDGQLQDQDRRVGAGRARILRVVRRVVHEHVARQRQIDAPLVAGDDDTRGRYHGRDGCNAAGVERVAGREGGLYLRRLLVGRVLGCFDGQRCCPVRQGWS